MKCLPQLPEEELAAEEKRRQKRIRDHEKYLRQKERKQKIAEGLIVPGEPYQLVCQCCGEPFHLSAPTLNFANPPAGRSSTGRKSGKPKKRKHHKLHKDCGLPQQTGQAAFLCPETEGFS